MDKILKDTAYLFSCGARNIQPDADGEYNIEEIMKTAFRHSVYPMVFLSVKSLYERNLINLKSDVYEFYYSQFFAYIVKKEQITAVGNAAVDLFEKNKISCCILKGESISGTYPNKECRVSSDVDLLISPKNEKKAMKILKNAGYEIHPRKKHSHHFEAYFKEIKLEVHIKLYNENCHRLWFSNCNEITESFMHFKTESGKEYKTLGINDNLKFISLHAIKHFFDEGVGIRQIMDILLFMNYYYDEIDWEGFNAFIKEMKFNKLMECFIGIGREYFKMQEERLPEAKYDRESFDRLVEDVFKGGTFGKAVKSRRGFMQLYSMQLLKSRNYEDPEKYMKQNFAIPLKRKIFPLFEDLVYRYPYIQENKRLLPLAWIHRWFDLCLSVVKRKKSVKSFTEIYTADENDKENEERIELMRELNLL